jgi:hypothetical protein
MSCPFLLDLIDEGDVPKLKVPRISIIIDQT